MDLPQRQRPAHFSTQERHNRAIIFFVTVCTQNRRPILANSRAHDALLAAWQKADSFDVGST
jgi:hypothetical protein